MNRRDFLKSSGLAAAFLFSRELFAGDQKHPNLLIIHTDEHNFRTLGCYRAVMSKEQALMWGEAVAETPNIDWLAQNGALCTSFYATTPVCSPSRAAFVSGRYPQNTPVVTNDIPLDDNIITFAEILKQKGYATGYAGKWHLDGPGKPQWAPDRKFGFEDNRYMFNRGHWKQMEDTAAGPRVKARKGEAPTYDVKGADAKSFTTDWLADKTVDFIGAHKGEPFCYMVSFPDPHGPDTVRAPYDMMFKDQKYRTPRTFDPGARRVPNWGKGDAGFNGMALYYGMVKCIDDNVGKILGALRKNGVIENTIVVFTSDHGDLRGEHHRQNKGVPFEGSAKIPFVIYYPGRIKGGTVISEALGCVDFLPTILSLMACKTAGREEGRDASGLFAAGGAPATWKDTTFVRSTGRETGGSIWLAAVTDRYKLVYSAVDDPWLFDLQQDPDEMENFFIHPAYRETVRELSRELQSYGEKFKDPYITQPAIKAALAWAVKGKEPYEPKADKQPGDSEGAGQKKKAEKRRRQQKSKQEG
jgi:arylsulfatase A-like enzyme